MKNILVDPIFNLQTIPAITPDKSLDDPATTVAQVFVETARPIILTQDSEKGGKADYVYLPRTAGITIHADEVIISGKLSFPGRAFFLFTRILTVEDDGAIPPAISVDGAPLVDDLAHPKKLDKDKAKIPGNPRVIRGGKGWITKEHAAEMNGTDGDDGKTGNEAGSVWVCCQNILFRSKEHKLTITARGGPGGDGQPGQDGADGAHGVNGKSIGDEAFMRQPESGTNGGDGAEGGKGGRAGQGGKGGSIRFHCIAEQPAVVTDYPGGLPGARGNGGAKGEHGHKGLGGKGGMVTSAHGTGWGPSGWTQVGDAPDGKDGNDGHDGARGDAADRAVAGSSTISWGPVKGEDLIKAASVTQLQMLSERTRADYLVTEPPDYSLRLLSLADDANAISRFVDSGKNMVVIATSRDGLRIRIYDAKSRLVVDKADDEMSRDLRPFQITVADILEAAEWQTPEDLRGLTSLKMQRPPLIEQLSRISGLSQEVLEKLNDSELSGWGQVTVFLLQMGIRDEAGLKLNLEPWRNIVIAEIARKNGYDEAGLRALTNQELIQLTLDPELLSPAPKNKFVLRGGMDFLRHRLFGEIPTMTMADVLQAAGWVKPDQLSWMQTPHLRQALANNLRWKSGTDQPFDKMYESDLIGLAAIMAFLLQMGIRNEAGLKGDPKCGREILIGELIAQCGYKRDDLQPMGHQELVRLALEPKPNNKFVLQGGMLFLRSCLYRTMSMADLLQAGNWLTLAELQKIDAQAQRKALIDRLSQISDLRKDVLEERNDQELIGYGALAAFLVQMGIRDEAGLKRGLDDYRNTLIVEMGGKCTHVSNLQSRGNQELVQLALEPNPQNKLVPRGGMILLQRRLLGKEIVLALKNPFAMAFSDVLQAGGWELPESSQQQRQALIGQLSRITHLPQEYFNKLNDYVLIGRGAVIVFLVQMGIRDEASLKVGPDTYRDILIPEIVRNTGQDEAALRKLNNKDLVRTALEPKPNNKFVLKGGMIFLRGRMHGATSIADILEAGTWLTSSQLGPMSASARRQALIDQLCRIGNLPKEIFETLNDADLLGYGAVTAFLIQMCIRDEAGLKLPLDHDRNTLIVAVAGTCGYDGGYLQGLDNQQLVRLALEPAPGNQFQLAGNLPGFRERLCYLPPDEREAFLLAAGQAAGYVDMWGSIGNRLEWLLQLLNAASADDPTNRKNEHPQKALAETIQPSVWAALTRYGFGLDYYGKTPIWVPNLSLDTYLEGFESSRELLKTAEKEYKRYFEKWKDQTQTITHINSVLNSFGACKEFLDKQIGILGTKLTETQERISTANQKCKKEVRDPLEKDLKKFESDVKHVFGLNLSTFFNCLSQLGFANFSEPARQHQALSKPGIGRASLVERGAVVGGFVGAAAMTIGPLGVMLHEAAENVLNDYGQSINRELLLDQLDVVRGDLDLRSEFVQREDGFKSNLASKRLVVELGQFDELCKQFNKTLSSAATLRKSLEEYIRNITSRNEMIDYYNALTQRLIDVAGEVKKLETQKDTVEGHLADNSSPGLPAITTFVTALYERAKAECLSQLYLAGRAYSFWALEPYTNFFNSVRGPAGFTSSSLASTHSIFTKLIQDRLESGYGSGSFTPARDSTEGSFGVVVVLSRETHPNFFTELISNNQADFQIEPASKESVMPLAFLPTPAAWSGPDRPVFQPSDLNPFSGKANVRLTKVRPWIVGMKTGGNHAVKLIHMGEEQFRRKDNVPYPARNNDGEPAFVLHQPKPIDFNYDPTGLMWDPGQPDKDRFRPGQLFKEGNNNVSDGDLGFPQPGANVKSTVFAPIGPFAKWRLIISPNLNNPLNLTDVKAVVIDFHVFFEGFDQ